MNVKIQKWGNSLGLRLSKKMCQQIGFIDGTEVSVVTKGSSIEIRPQKSKNTRIKYNLKDSFTSAFYSHIIRLKELGRMDKLSIETQI